MLLYSHILSLRLQPTVVTLGSLIAGAPWPMAHRWLRELRRRGLEANQVAFNAAATGPWPWALQRQAAAVAEGLKADVVGCSKALSECEAAAEWAQASTLGGAQIRGATASGGGLFDGF